VICRLKEIGGHDGETSERVRNMAVARYGVEEFVSEQTFIYFLRNVARFLNGRRRQLKSFKLLGTTHMEREYSIHDPAPMAFSPHPLE